MHQILRDLKLGLKFTGDIGIDSYNFLLNRGHAKTAEHCKAVGLEAGRIANLYGENNESAKFSGYLHDISVIFSNSERIAVARKLNLDILKEETDFPMIIHQKISRIMSEQIFGIDDVRILDAIECHTTLKARATSMDKILFIADKIVWDQVGVPPYREKLLESLNVSLDHASFVYIQFLWDQRHKLKVVHPWLAEAYEELRSKV